MKPDPQPQKPWYFKSIARIIAIVERPPVFAVIGAGVGAWSGLKYGGSEWVLTGAGAGFLLGALIGLVAWLIALLRNA